MPVDLGIILSILPESIAASFATINLVFTSLSTTTTSLSWCFPFSLSSLFRQTGWAPNQEEELTNRAFRTVRFRSSGLQSLTTSRHERWWCQSHVTQIPDFTLELPDDQNLQLHWTTTYVTEPPNQPQVVATRKYALQRSIYCILSYDITWLRYYQINYYD